MVISSVLNVTNMNCQAEIGRKHKHRTGPMEGKLPLTIHPVSTATWTVRQKILLTAPDFNFSSIFVQR